MCEEVKKIKAEAELISKDISVKPFPSKRSKGDYIQIFILPLVITALGIFATIWTNERQMEREEFRAVQTLISQLYKNNNQGAVISLAQFGRYSIEPLILAVNNAEPKIQQSALISLKIIGDEVGDYIIREVLESSDPKKKDRELQNAIIIIGELQVERASEHLLKLINDTSISSQTRLGALTAVLNVGITKKEFHNIDFSNTVVQRTYLFDSETPRTVYLDSVHFLNCNFNRSDLTKSSFKHTIFEECDLRAANLQTTNLFRAEFINCEFDSLTNFAFAKHKEDASFTPRLMTEK